MSRRLRVVYLDHVARLSGAEVALARVLPRLAEHVDTHVVLGENGALVERLEAAGISVEVLAMPSQARDVRRAAVRVDVRSLPASAAAAAYTATLRRRLRELRPDLLHTNSLKSALYGGVAGRLSRIPVVWHVRDRIADDYLPAAAVRLVRVASRALPTAVIANSRATLETLPSLRPSLPAVVVHDAVDAVQAGSTGQATRATGDAFRVGVVGRLAPWKGQHVFLEAFARAFPGGDEQAALIGDAMFGEDDYVARLTADAERLGLRDRVEFRGFREDVWAELARLDVLVHCSVTPEPFGQVVIEGMAAGVAVVAAAAGGPAEVVTPGIDGLLTPPGEAAALASTLRRLRDEPDLRALLAANGRRSARGFTPQRAAAEVLRVYDAVVERRAGG